MKVIIKGNCLKESELNLEAGSMKGFLENRKLEGYIGDGDLIIEERSKADEGETR